jgi:hypothetical protein
VKERYEGIVVKYNRQKDSISFQLFGLDKLNIVELYNRHLFLITEVEKCMSLDMIESSFEVLCNCFNADNFDNYQSYLYQFYFIYDIEDDYVSWLRTTHRKEKIKNALSD